VAIFSLLPKLFLEPTSKLCVLSDWNVSGVGPQFASGSGGLTPPGRKPFAYVK
jgi:hypothetical protein